MPRANPVLDRLPQYPTALLEARRRQVQAAGKRLYDFGIGDPVEEVPAFIRDALREAVPTCSGYPSAESLADATGAIQRYIRRRFGLELGPEAILPTSGGKEATFQFPLLVAEPGAPDSGVAFPDPGYPGYIRGAMFAGADLVPVPLGGDFRMRLWELPTALLETVRLAWINNPHNPTGALLGRDELRRTWELCREHDILLVSDECYIDVWSEERPVSLLEIATEGVLVLHSLSKRNGLTGYRTGFVAGDPHWIARFAELRGHVGLSPQDFVNAAAVAAWSDDAHAEQRRLRFARRKARLVAFLAEIGFEVVASEATFYVWARVPGGRSGIEQAAELLELGIVATPGEWFSLAGAGAGYIRFALCPSDDELEEALAVWRAAMEAR